MAFKFCPECGFKLEKESKFCPECGFKLIGESTPIQNGLFGGESFLDEALFSDDVDFDELESAFEVQVEKQNDQEDIYQNKVKKANLMIINGKYAEAIKEYNKLIDEDVDRIEPYVGIIKAYSKNYTEDHNEEVEKNINFITTLFDLCQLKKDKEFAAYYSRYKAFIDKREAARIAEELRKSSPEYIAKKNKFLEELNFKRDGEYVYFGNFPSKILYKYDISKVKNIVEFKSPSFKSDHDKNIYFIDEESGKRCLGKRAVFVKEIEIYGKYKVYCDDLIPWKIIDEKDGILTLISKYSFFEASYGWTDKYKDSGIRKRLIELYNFIFNDTQKSILVNNKIQCKSGIHEETLNENIWLLSRDEFEKYKDKFELEEYSTWWWHSVGSGTILLRDIVGDGKAKKYLTAASKTRIVAGDSSIPSRIRPVIMIDVKKAEYDL